MNTTRRAFFAAGGKGVLGAAAVAGLAGAFAPTVASAKEAGKGVTFKVGGRTGTIGAKNLPESLDEAKKLGLDGVEIEAHSGGKPGAELQCFDKALQQAYRDKIKETGMVVSSICMGHCNTYPVFSDPHAAGWIRGTIDVTAAVGGKVILVPFFGNGDMRLNGKSGTLDWSKANKAVEVLKGVADHAREKGITLGLENTLSAEHNLEIVGKVNAPAVQVYYDIANSFGGGYDVPKEIRMLGKKMAQIHFKERGCLLGQGKIDMAAIRDAMVDIGYEGWIVLETPRPLGAEISAAYNTGFIRALFA